MQQAIHASEVDEGSVVGKRTDGSGHEIAFFHFGVAAILRRALFFFHHRAPIDDHIFVGNVELNDAADDLLIDELFHLASVARSTARARHEGANSDVYTETALDDCGDAAGNGGFSANALSSELQSLGCAILKRESW